MGAAVCLEARTAAPAAGGGGTMAAARGGARRAWVGCWPQPSPALTMGAAVCLEARTAAPAAGWRKTIASTPRRSRVTTVSVRDSPFETAKPFSESEITSAPHRRAASSKETAVRVADSKKARQTVLPASGRGTPAGRELEGDGGPRRGLEEGQAHGLAGERAGDAAFLVGRREVEDLPHLLSARVLQRETALNSQRRSPPA